MQNTIFTWVDRFLFIKNGYTFVSHLVPFSIASLLLLSLSVPKDNLILKLGNLLKEPSWMWLPAGLVTAVASIVYIATIHEQVRKAYLWPDRDCVRTITTSAVYLVLCTLMAFAVLKSIISRSVGWVDIWTCFLIAVLSLTGIGWSKPKSWAESMGIKSPDYTQGRIHANQLGTILSTARDKANSDQKDIQAFLTAANGLRSNIETNLPIEPEWAKGSLSEASNALYNLIDQVNTKFPTTNPEKVSDFATACRCQQKFLYQKLIENLTVLSKYWQDWRCP